MKIVVPIAGRGSRFQSRISTNPEYKGPKPLIVIGGKPMVSWALESLPFINLPKRPFAGNLKVDPSDIIFIALTEHQKKYRIADKLKEMFGDVHVELITNVTRGALETALVARKYLSNEAVIISDCDHYFDGKELCRQIKERDNDVVGIIPVFPPPDGEVKWSYTLFDKQNTALAVGEKDAQLARQGAYANIGAYYFSSGDVFIREAQEMISGNHLHGPDGKQEFYVAPLYQRMIKKGMRVKAAIISQVWGLGTPEDVENFLKVA